jgi:hypothetical protein
MNETIMKAYLDIEQAVKRYDELVQEQIEQLRGSEGANPETLERLINYSRGLRQGTSVYLPWAKYIAIGCPKSEELIQDDSPET